MGIARLPLSVRQDPFAPLFSSDLGREVHETFEELLDFGASVTAATQETVHRFHGALHDPDDAPVIILALAGLQVKHRQVHASIRDAALGILRSGQAENLIAAEPTARRKVRTLLQELQEVLEALDVQPNDDDPDAT